MRITYFLHTQSDIYWIHCIRMNLNIKCHLKSYRQSPIDFITLLYINNNNNNNILCACTYDNKIIMKKIANKKEEEEDGY